MPNEVAVYVHIPFCPTKCGYCDFNSYAGMGEDLVERTVRSIVREIEQSDQRGRPARTIFFGGGTPTFLSAEQLLRIFHAVLKAHAPIADCEITSEANPGTVDQMKFGAMRSAGFNRISLGAQSFVESDLTRLGRVHQAGDIERAVIAAREAGFINLNLDLMFGLPQQSPAAWNANLNRALALDVPHLSLYCLTIEQNTAFFKLQQKNQLPLPGDEDQVTMYEACADTVFAAGYEQYEISNYARPGFACRHNLEYWYGNEYVGYGPGAVGCVDAGQGMRRGTNLKHPVGYCDAVEAGKPLHFDEEALGQEELKMERIMLGLRLNEGFSATGMDLLASELSKLESRGWLVQELDRVKLTREGRHFASEVALALV